MAYISKNQMCYTVVVINPLETAMGYAPISARTAIVTLNKEDAYRYCEHEMDSLEQQGYTYTHEYDEGNKSTVIFDKPGFTAAVIFQKSALVQ